MNYLLDTNVISELISRQPNSAVISWIDQQLASQLFLSVITIGELQKGISKLAASQRKLDLQTWLYEELLIRFQAGILALDTPVMLKWGELVGNLAQTGRNLAAIDSLIAAQALYYNCCLVTRNTNDFQTTGIQLFNPWGG